MSHTDPAPRNFVAADPDSAFLLSQVVVPDDVIKNRVAGVKSVLVMLSARGMSFDSSALAQKIGATYPGCRVYFMSSQGKAVGDQAPQTVDLLIDFTGPKTRQSFLLPRALKARARVSVGRNAGYFRKSYTRIFDEKSRPEILGLDIVERERAVQKAVLALAGVAMLQSGESHLDRGKVTPLTLPPLSRQRG